MGEEATSFRHLSIILLSILSILTILANSTGIFVISRTKELSKTPSSYLIRNLLTVHFIQGLIVFPLYVAKKHGVESVVLYQFICDGFRFTFMVTFYMAVFSVLFIATDRFIAVVFTMHYREIVTKQRLLLCIVAIWIYITSISLIPFKHSDVNINSNDTNVAIVTNVTMPRKSSIVKCNYNQSELWTILMLGFNCLLPYITMVIMYQYIIFQLKKIERKAKIESSRFKIEEINKNRKITKVSLLLSIAYLVTWSPSVLYYILWCVCPHTCFTDAYQYSKEETYITFAMKYLAFLDAIVSPVIYCFFSERFRYFVPCLKGDKTKQLHLAHVKPITR